MNTLLAASICSYEIQATICYTNQVLVIKTNYSRHLHLYISETSHPKQRKILATFKTLGTMSGNLLAYIMGAVFDDWRDSALVLSAIPFLASVTFCDNAPLSRNTLLASLCWQVKRIKVHHRPFIG